MLKARMVARPAMASFTLDSTGDLRVEKLQSDDLSAHGSVYTVHLQADVKKGKGGNRQIGVNRCMDVWYCKTVP
jgi:hypothetical protein